MISLSMKWLVRVKMVITSPQKVFPNIAKKLFYQVWWIFATRYRKNACDTVFESWGSILFNPNIYHLGTYPKIRLSPTLNRSEMYHLNFFSIFTESSWFQMKISSTSIERFTCQFFAARALASAKKKTKN